MAQRVRKLTEMLDFRFQSIMDLGCGQQTLKQYFPKTTRYYPINQFSQAKGTIVKDFNKGEFLNQKVDICFASGIFEYIYIRY